MFWGLIMEPHKRYTQTVEKSFHVSMASLDVCTAGSYVGPVQVMMNYENRNYLLCTLQKGSTLQVPLDLNFQEGTKIAFTSNGSGHVHLTGYLVPDEDDFDELEEEEEDDVPQLVGKSAKRKNLNISNQLENNVKRSKHLEEEESSDDDDDDDESEEEFKDDNLLEDDDDEDEDQDEDEDEGVEDEEEDDDEEDEEEIVKQPVKKAKQDKQQPQQNKKQEKQKLANGKDVKQEQKQQEKKVKSEQQVQNTKQEQKKRVIEGGVQIEDLKVGTGAPAKSGKFVSVYYVGRLKNGKKFDSCNQGEGFKFRLGKKEVIQGWDVGISGMKIGGKRRITIPPAFAYGAKGSPPVIPPNSVLVFEVELKNVH